MSKKRNKGERGRKFRKEANSQQKEKALWVWGEHVSREEEQNKKNKRHRREKKRERG